MQKPRHLSTFLVAAAFLVALPLARPTTEFLVPPGPQDDPRSIVAGPDGNLWFTNSNSRKIGRITIAGTLAQFPVPGGIFPNQITAGPDGALWFTDTIADFIGRITTTGNITEFPLAAGSNPVGIVRGADGNLWFAENGAAKIGSITPAGVITEFSAPAGTDPYRLALGSDGNYWFTNFNLNQIGRITPTGAVTLFPIVSGGKGAGIAAGPDGNLWFAENNLSNVARITTAGVVAEFAVPSTAIPADSIVAGPDGNLWFTEKFIRSPRKLGRVTVGGVVTEFSLIGVGEGSGLAVGPDQMLWGTGIASENIFKADLSGNLAALFPLNRGSGVAYLTTGPDGALWFTEQTSEKIGRITTAGALTEFSIPNPSAFPQNIVTGPDGALWFTENGAGSIGRVTTSGVFSEFPITSGPGCPQGIARGADGNLWVADGCGAASAIEKFSTTGIETDFNLGVGSFPFGITAGPDGNLWFTELAGNQIGRITPQGVITEFPIAVANIFPTAITTGPDGNLWFANQDLSGTVGKITTNGAITLFQAGLSGFETDIAAGADGALWVPDPNLPSPTLGLARITTAGILSEKLPTTYPHSGATGIITGPDHKLWFTEFNGSRIARMSAISGAASQISPVEGVPVNATLASFTAGTPTALPSDFVASINWGDGSTTAGTVTGPAGGPFSVAGNHTYADEGNLNLKVTLHDSVDNEDYAAARAIVVSDGQLSAGSATLPAPKCTEGVPCTFTVASFKDANPNAAASDFTAIIAWGDGTNSNGVIARNPAVCAAEFCVSGTHTYMEEALYPTQADVRDIGGSQLQLAEITAVVADAKLTVSGRNLSTPHGTQLNAVVASFTDADPNAIPSDFTVTIAWGDGTSSPGTITANSGFFDATGTHTFSSAGSHTAKITVLDVGGSSGFAFTSISDDYPIAASGRTLRFRLGQPFTFTVASVSDDDPAGTAANLSAVIDWGDGSSSIGTIVAMGNGNFDLVGSHAYTHLGGFDITIHVHDAGGAQAVATSKALMGPRPFSF